MADGLRPSRKATIPKRRGGWILQEIVGTLLEPLIRGALWLVLHAALAVKIAFIKLFLS